MTWLEKWLERFGLFHALRFADEDGAAGGDDEDDDEDGEKPPAGDEDGDDPKDVEGLRAALEKERELRRGAERDAKKNGRAIRDLNKEIEKIKASAGTDEEKKILEERESAAAAERAKLSKPIKRSAIIAAATGRLANPSVAVRLVDLDDIEIDDEGDVDQDTVKAAIDAILEEMPELKTKGAARSGGDTSNGKPGGAGEPDINDLLRKAVAGRK